MNIAQPIGTEISSVTFRPLPPSDVKALSVKQLTHPLLFDSLNRPAPGGLYDAALGPVGKSDLCATCHLGQMQCPGHFGHIQLPTPVYNPLFFREMYGLLKSTCLYCHNFKLVKAQVHRYWAKLTLLEAGQIEAAERLDDSVIAPGIHDAKERKKAKRKRGEEVASESEDENSDEPEEYGDRLASRIEAFVNRSLEEAKEAGDIGRKETVAARTAKRTMVDTFLKTALGRKRCDNCGANSASFRNDGYAKIFEQAMTDKQRALNEARGIERVDVMLRRRIQKRADSNASPTEESDSDASDQDIDMAAASSESEEEDTTLSQAALQNGNSQTNAETSHEVQPAKPTTGRKAGSRYVPSAEVQSHLQLLFENEQKIMRHVYGGGSKGGISTADMFFFEVLLVPPTKFRPASILGDQVMENAQNELLVKILTTSTRIRDLNGDLAKAETAKIEASEKTRIFDNLVSGFVQLQHDVNSFLDSSKNPMMLPQGKQPPQGIRQVLEKKEGLFRKHMMGKRVNYAARSVISPDPNIDTNEIGVPPVFAKKLTYPEPVTPHNFQELRRAVIRGPSEWPGAVYVQNEDGKLTSLANLTEESRTAIANQLLTPQSSRYGNGDGKYVPPSNAVNKKVYRHLKNGDALIMNRQPTLHKNSMIVFRARVLPGEKTIRMHYANCNGFNADFDGDEMNMHFPQNEAARAEALLIADADDQYLVATSGSPLRGLIQDHVVSGVHMTKRDTFFTREEYQQLLYGSLRPEDDEFGDGWLKTVPPAILRPRPMWTGKQIITTILKNITPANAKGLNLTSKTKVPAKYWGPGSEEGNVIFVDGELLCGILDKSQFGASAFGLVHSVHEIYGAPSAGRLLTIFGRLFTKYVQLRGFSCRMDDLMLTPTGDKWRTDLLQNGSAFGLEAASEYVGLKDVKDKNVVRRELRTRLEEVLRDDEKLAGLDATMKGKMNGLTSSIINKCIPEGLHRLFPQNNMQTMTVSGAKGSNVNVSQISCLLGQQELEGRRVPLMVSGKSLPSFKPFDTSAKSGGFIAGRFLTGIKPQEYYFHCMAGREGLIDTAVKTSRSGYLQRCLIKHLEGIKVHYDHTVRDADDSVFQFHYGEDSLDVTKQKHLTQFKFSAQNYDSLLSKYQPQAMFGNQFMNQSEAPGYVKKARRKPKKYDPALNHFAPSRYFGSVSERFDAAIEKYVDDNPDKLLRGKGQELSEQSRLYQPSKAEFRALMQLRYLHSLVAPGESVGLLASQSVGEPSTQMTLNTFHFAGFGAANVTLGIPRLREIIMTASASIKTPTMTLRINDKVSETAAADFCKSASKITLGQIIDNVIVREKLLRDGDDDDNRRKVYTIRLNFFGADEYSAEYNVTAAEVMHTLEGRFMATLSNAIQREMKGLHRKGKEADGGVPEIGQASKAKEVVAGRGAANEEDGNDAGGDASDDDDGDASHTRRAQQSQQQSTYDDPDEEEEDIMRTDNPEQMDFDPDVDIDEQIAQASDEFDSDDERLVERRAKRDAEQATATNKERRRIQLQKVRRLAPAARRFDFDTKNGAWCEVDIEHPADSKKLLMLSIVERVLKRTVIHEIRDITRCFALKPEAANDTTRSLATEGVNIRGIWEHVITNPITAKGDTVIDLNKLYSNDIAAILRTYGVEAARQAIVKEIAGVFAVYGIDVDPRHLSLIAEYMTFEGSYRAFSRRGIESNTSPFAKMSFETTCHFLTEATLHQDSDDLSNPSARIVMGRPPAGGTGAFDVLTPITNINGFGTIQSDIVASA